MHVTPTALPDVKIVELESYPDERGCFMEMYNKRAFAAAGITAELVQDNCSRSRQNVLRGLHYQVRQSQAKLVRVTSGEILDIAVDLRRRSPTFGRWVAVILSADRHRVLWIPEGFAHGFVARSASAEVVYKTSDYYAPAHERTIAWDDPDLAIDWQLPGPPLLSAKDRTGIAFRDAEVFE